MDNTSDRNITWNLTSHMFHIYNNTWIKTLNVYTSNNGKNLYEEMNIYNNKIYINILYCDENITIEENVTKRRISSVLRYKDKDIQAFKSHLLNDVKNIKHLYIRKYGI